MFAYLEGPITEINPAYVVIDCGGVGYMINISLYTFSQLKDKARARVLTHQIVREDALLLFGFIDNIERRLFLHLLSVSGVGANTARIILSSLTPEEVRMSIISEDVRKLQSIKGIGAKTAQRIIVDLKDKLTKEDPSIIVPTSPFTNAYNESLSALTILGFNRVAAEKALQSITKLQPHSSSEELIKRALQML